MLAELSIGKVDVHRWSPCQEANDEAVERILLAGEVLLPSEHVGFQKTCRHIYIGGHDEVMTIWMEDRAYDVVPIGREARHVEHKLDIM